MHMSRWFVCKAHCTQELSARRLRAWLQDFTDGPILSAIAGPPRSFECDLVYLAVHSSDKPVAPIELHPLLRENWVVKNKRNAKRHRFDSECGASEWLFAEKKRPPDSPSSSFSSSLMGLRAIVCKTEDIPNQVRSATRMEAGELLYLFCAYHLKRQSPPPSEVSEPSTATPSSLFTTMPSIHIDALNSQDTQQLLRLLRQHTDAVSAITAVLTQRLEGASTKEPLRPDVHSIRMPPEDDQLVSILQEFFGHGEVEQVKGNCE